MSPRAAAAGGGGGGGDEVPDACPYAATVTLSAHFTDEGFPPMVPSTDSTYDMGQAGPSTCTWHRIASTADIEQVRLDLSGDSPRWLAESYDGYIKFEKTTGATPVGEYVALDGFGGNNATFEITDLAED